jgi:hypothetical protein
VTDGATCSRGWADRCASATSARCRCACGGKNHGTARPLPLFDGSPSTSPTMTRTTRRAQWGIALAESRAVILTDVGPHDMYPTITNDAEAVVEDFASTLDGRRLFYVDTEGRVDELLVAGGKFAGFAPGWPTLEAALAALRDPAPAIVDDLATRVDAWLRAVIAEDDGKALALCPFNWEGAKSPEANEANPYRFRLRLRPPEGPFDDGTWVGGVAETPIAAIRLALTASPGLAKRLAELEACP